MGFLQKLCNMQGILQTQTHVCPHPLRKGDHFNRRQIEFAKCLGEFKGIHVLFPMKQRDKQRDGQHAGKPNNSTFGVINEPSNTSTQQPQKNGTKVHDNS